MTCSQTKAKSLLFPLAEMTLLQTSEPRHSRPEFTGSSAGPCRSCGIDSYPKRRLTMQQRIEEKLAASSIPFLARSLPNTQASSMIKPWKQR